jgi:GMP synthase (glutamine-hydrolysing)
MDTNWEGVMDYQAFVAERVEEIRGTVGDGLAVNALSGGVDSSVVTAIGHRALGDHLKTYFIDNALMREDEPEQVVAAFAEMGIPVELVDARQEFLDALKGLTDPEEKRQAVRKSVV